MQKELWDNCLQFIKEQIPEQSFKTWFTPIIPMKLDNGVLTIQVPSQFFYEWLEENYVHILKQAIQKELGAEGRLEYSVVIDSGNGSNQPYTVNLAGNNGYKKYGQNYGNHPAEIRNPFAVPSVDNHMQFCNLNKSYVFENYIEGDCNRLARSAGYAVAQRPGITSFNPLMIYGGVGLGKTHLYKLLVTKFVAVTKTNLCFMWLQKNSLTNLLRLLKIIVFKTLLIFISMLIHSSLMMCSF
jgi:chromosomal replication initiator protein